MALVQTFKVAFRGLLPLFCLALTGCLVPEKFTVSVNVHKDGSYAYKYDGTAIHGLAAAQIKEKGGLTSKDERELKEAAQKEAKKPGVKKFTYVGDARFDTSLEYGSAPSKKRQDLELIVVKKDKTGLFTASSPTIRPQVLDDLKKLDITPSGDISITLPDNATVVAHNASGTPGMFSKAYTWKINSFAQTYEIKYRLPE